MFEKQQKNETYFTDKDKLRFIKRKQSDTFEEKTYADVLNQGRNAKKICRDLEHTNLCGGSSQM